MTDITDLYQELILDHSRHPRHFGPLENATNVAEGINPICGDNIKVFIILKNENLENIQFAGHGCALCISCASIMSEQLHGKSKKEALAQFSLFHQLFTAHSCEENIEQLGKSKVFSSVKNYPSRIKCTTLPWHTMKAALNKSTTHISTEHD
jgi:nitrogen fixation NifU-like protein